MKARAGEFTIELEEIAASRLEDYSGSPRLTIILRSGQMFTLDEISIDKDTLHQWITWHKWIAKTLDEIHPEIRKFV